VLLTKDETVLHDTIVKITGIVRSYGMETNTGKTKKIVIIKMQISPV